MKRKGLLGLIALLAASVAAVAILAGCNKAEGATYTVTFDLNYSGAPAATTASALEGGRVDQPADPAREGFDFLGWFEKDGDALKAEPWSFFGNAVNGDLTLYAAWNEVLGYQKAPAGIAIDFGDGIHVTISAVGAEEGKALEYSADGVNWQSEPELELAYGAFCRLSVRYAAYGEYRPSAPCTRYYVTMPDPANFTVTETPGTTESLTVTAADGKDYLYSDDGVNYSDDPVLDGFSVFDDTGTVYVKIEGDGVFRPDSVPLEIAHAIPHRADRDVPQMFYYFGGQNGKSPAFALNEEAIGLNGGDSENSVRMEVKGPTTYESILIRTSKYGIKADVIAYALNGDGSVDTAADGSAVVRGNTDLNNIDYGSIPYKTWVTVYLPNSATLNAPVSYQYALFQTVLTEDTVFFFDNIEALDEDEMPRYIRHNNMAKSWIEHGWADATRTFTNNALPERMNGDNEISYVLTSSAGTSNNYIHKPNGAADWGMKLDVKLAEGIADIRGAGVQYGIPIPGEWMTLYFPTSAAGNEYDHHEDHVNTCCLFQVIAQNNVTIYIDNIAPCTEEEYTAGIVAFKKQWDTIDPDTHAEFTLVPDETWCMTATFTTNLDPAHLHGDNSKRSIGLTMDVPAGAVGTGGFTARVPEGKKIVSFDVWFEPVIDDTHTTPPDSIKLNGKEMKDLAGQWVTFTPETDSPAKTSNMIQFSSITQGTKVIAYIDNVVFANA